MGLPTIVLPREVFTFHDGQTTEIRSLSRAEAIQVRTLNRTEGASEEEIAILAECFIIQCATETSEAEAKTWHSTSPSGEVERLVDAIARLSGLNPDEGKDDAEA